MRRLIFALVIIMGSVFFTYLSPGEEIKIIKDMGLGSIMNLSGYKRETTPSSRRGEFLTS